MIDGSWTVKLPDNFKSRGGHEVEEPEAVRQPVTKNGANEKSASAQARKDLLIVFMKRDDCDSNHLHLAPKELFAAYDLSTGFLLPDLQSGGSAKTVRRK